MPGQFLILYHRCLPWDYPHPDIMEGHFALMFLTLLSIPKCYVMAGQWPDLLDGTCSANMPHYFYPCYGGQYQWYQISIYTTWNALYNLQPATIHLNLIPFSLQTLWRAILMISHRNIYVVIRPVQHAAGYDSSQTSLLALSRRYGG